MVRWGGGIFFLRFQHVIFKWIYSGFLINLAVDVGPLLLVFSADQNLVLEESFIPSTRLKRINVFTLNCLLWRRNEWQEHYEWLSAWTSLSKMASITKGVLNHKEAVSSLAVARQLLQSCGTRASGVVLLEGCKTCKGIYHHYHRMDLALCMITGGRGDGEGSWRILLSSEGQRSDRNDGIIDAV